MCTLSSLHIVYINRQSGLGISAAFCVCGGVMGGCGRDSLREKKRKMVGEGEEGEKKEKQGDEINVLSTAACSSLSVLHL